jgi:hypothetical protein
VRRDPEQAGKDKPTHTPDEVFAQVIEIEEKAKRAAEERKARKPGGFLAGLDAPQERPVPKVEPQDQAAREARLARLLDLLDDDSTVGDW